MGQCFTNMSCLTRFNILEFKKKVYIWETEGGFYMEIRGGNSFVSFKCLDALWMMYVEFA